MFLNKNEFAFLKIGDFDNSLLNDFKLLVKESFVDNIIKFPSNLIEILEYKNVLLLVQLGKINIKDLNSLKRT